MLTIRTGRMPEILRTEKPPADPAKLDRAADHALHFGLRKTAEMLAHRAQLLREAGR
jgi:hypothetical protein